MKQLLAARCIAAPMACDRREVRCICLLQCITRAKACYFRHLAKK
ncbi:hypothetical protein [Xanthomonas vesicatoria]|nr:hypothetical protein [Xanthomonas vesicatoria]